MFGKKPVSEPQAADLGDKPAPPELPSVIDLTEAAQRARVRVRVLPDDNPLVRMTNEERMRLYVRIICELVAYGEDDDTSSPSSSYATAGRS